MTFYTTAASPIGELLLTSDGRALTGLHLAPFGTPAGRRDGRLFRAVLDQLGGYFAGEMTMFELDVDPPGTPFQRAVWTALRRIPYGRTVSYGDLARRVGRPRAVRAVGRANGTNPIAIVIPCHRVIGADGSLTGYGGGLERKAALLALEGVTISR